MFKPVTVGAYSRRYRALETVRADRLLIHSQSESAAEVDRTKALRLEARRRRRWEARREEVAWPARTAQMPTHTHHAYAPL